MKTTISMSDLIHTGQTNINAIPLGISLVASYALEHLGDKIEIELFKYPGNFAEYLEKTTPDIVCFSSYVWNININCEFARRIKRKYPRTVIIFGGPNYPIETNVQEEFLLSHPDIDFYIFRDGEQPFLELLNTLFAYEFNIQEIKNARLKIPNCHYINDGKIVLGGLLRPLTDIDKIPSPYLSGLCDKFLGEELVPLMLTARGCPFSCTFCQDGAEYFCRVRKFSLQRIKDELQYIAQHTTNPNLMFADSNFGMYKNDVEICREIASVQEKYGWPKYFMGLGGKNNKERVIEAASIIQKSVFGRDSVFLSAAVQSMDKKVLKNIKRQNVSSSVFIDIAKAAASHGSNSFSEVILCLPGDTKDAHIKSIFELIQSGINVVRSHQFLMLNGAEVSTRTSRRQYGIGTRFRVMPKTIGPYKLFGRTFFAPEIDEVCVKSATMSFDDYLECRMFDLTVEIFYNNGIFQEILNFLKLYQISSVSFVKNIHKHISFVNSPLSDLYDGFLRETKELWDTEEEVKIFLRQPGIIERYMSGELGNNEQLKYRALAVSGRMDDLHQTAFNVAEELLIRKGCFNEQIRDYLKELAEYSLSRKKDMFSTEITIKKVFRYDFVSLENYNFKDNPFSYYRPEGISMLFIHDDAQEKLIRQYIKIYGLSDYGIGSILSNASHVSTLYRRAKID
ncbi:radical SAM protein [bacterium]|nr:radical SAM protein [bacterium]MBU3956623.1 radical SAM protein [bacterium]